MKKLQLLFTFLVATLLTTHANIKASERKFITRQVQLGLMESFFNLAHGKNPATQDQIKKECTDRNLELSQQEIYKAWLFVQQLPANKELNDCFTHSYNSVKDQQKIFDTKTIQCQNMIHDFFQAQSSTSIHKSDK